MRNIKLAIITASLFSNLLFGSSRSQSHQHHAAVNVVHHSRAHHAVAVGYASYYSNYYNGRKTANGERFSNNAYTAASNKLPLGSRVRVTDLQTRKSVVVRVNDRGPYVKGRAIDLSRRAAEDIGMRRVGVAKVQITRLS